MTLLEKEDILWILIDLQYLNDINDFSTLSQTSKYFNERMKKSKHIEKKKESILKIFRKWKSLSSWNRFHFPQEFKILKNEMEIIYGNGSGLYEFKKLNISNYRMIAGIWIKSPISNLYDYNPNGYTWHLGCGNKLVDKHTFKKRSHKYRKLNFFNGGGLYPNDLLSSSSHLRCSSEPFSEVKIVWVYTNITPTQAKTYQFKWITKGGWRWVEKLSLRC